MCIVVDTLLIRRGELWWKFAKIIENYFTDVVVFHVPFLFWGGIDRIQDEDLLKISASIPLAGELVLSLWPDGGGRVC